MKVLKLVHSVHDDLATAAWASVFAFVIFLMAFVIPNLPKAALEAQRLRAQQIAEENEQLCQNLQLEHHRCLIEVGDFRHRVESRFAEHFF